MSVQQATAIDQIAVGEGGRVLLAMTEDRPYTIDSIEQLSEDFRLKLNGYVYAIRSGQLADALPNGVRPAGFDIVLFCPSTPPADVLEMIGTADGALHSENVSIRYRIVDDLATARPQDPSELSVEEMLVEIANAMVAAMHQRWTVAVYRPSVVTGRSQDELLVGDGGEYLIPIDPPPDRIRDIVPWLRHKMYEPGRGTWLSAVLRLEPDGTLCPHFNYDEQPDWWRPVDPSLYRDELQNYPRSDQHIPAGFTAPSTAPRAAERFPWQAKPSLAGLDGWRLGRQRPRRLEDHFNGAGRSGWTT